MKKNNFSYIIITFLLISNSIFAQLSPGDLSNAHKDLEGLSNCTKCHVLGEKVYNSKCLECHTEIKERIDADEGYHSSSEVKGKECYNCHSDHHGRNFELIRFDQKSFNHDLTGYQLTGKHDKLECSKCHNSQFSSFTGERKKTFLGLNNKCISCHEDIHNTTLGNDCQTCHTTQSFKPADLFDHSKTKFVLKGAHTKVECLSCHKNIQSENSKTFSVQNFGRCIDCHQDVHKGKFGSNCLECHNEASFRNTVNLQKFDHDRTNFALVGKHENVECSKCHEESYTVKINHKLCSDCHEDYHKGELTKDDYRDCSVCHTEKGFSPSLFGIVEHSKTKFALDGSHLAVPCINCHYKNDKWSFLFNDLSCVACHENIHENKISDKFFIDNGCKNCHNSDGWSVNNFDHSKTGFELIGTHLKTSCRNCHFEDKEGSTVQIFQGLPRDCEFCHEDIHFQQFRINDKTDCARCHGYLNWEPVNFNHSETDFPLDGAHINVSCEKCHPKKNVKTGVFVQYKYEEIKCKTCHE